jgi:hypothetical protein
MAPVFCPTKYPYANIAITFSFLIIAWKVP